MKEIEMLQEWYFSNCNEDWEHTYGIKIENIDNPGWMIKIDLIDTPLEGVSYDGYSYGVGDEAESSGDEWLFTRIENGRFVGCGGPFKLGELITLFLQWAKENA